MKNNIRFALASLISAWVLVSPAGAELKGRYELSVQGGAMKFEGDANLENAMSYGGRLGHFFTEKISAEISGFGGATEKKSSGADVPFLFPAAAASYHFRFGKFMPFVQAGAGVLRFNPAGGGASTSLAPHGGGGLKYFLKPALLLRADLDYVLAADNGRGTHNVMGMLGVSWLFETSEEEAPQKAKPASPPDADHDGVPNAKDFCAGTPPGTKVDAQGCPAPADADSDGVSDRKDKCPGTAAGVKVDAQGCPVPLDTDSDGVTDDKDKCPGTAAGAEVDAEGCQLSPDFDGDGVRGDKDKCPGTAAGMKVDAKGCPLPVDTDSDGVPDGEDKCAGTPAGTGVDPEGCPVPVDADADGVVDDKDKCPNTAAGTKVNKKGCPVDADSDADGVIDDNDSCAGTPAGVKVDAKGCPVPLDKDSDGVTDEKDECANTPAGTIVDAKGCPQTVKAPGDKWVLNDFARNSDVIRPQSRKILNGVAATLKARPRASICLEVEGHTDTTGSKRYNLKLSKWRAQEVRAYLARKGVTAAGMEAAGYGGAMPIANNATKEGRKANRRVELKSCPEIPAVSEGKWILSTFTANSEAVRLRSRRVLAEVVARLRSDPSLRLRIDGHTDISGSKRYNQKLSKWRAEVVKKYMVRRGIAAKRITIRGHGGSKPIADNATYEGRMANRRVELTLAAK